MRYFPSVPLPNLGEKGEVFCPEGLSLSLFFFLLNFTRLKQSKRKDLALCHELQGNHGKTKSLKCRVLKLLNIRGDLVYPPECNPPQGY